MKIYLGPAGTPTSDTISGIKKVRELGLNAMEVEFVYGVRMSNEVAKIVGRVAKENNIKLSVHAPYYINLNSDDKQKIDASIKRILRSCERADNMNAEYVVFHPGFYMDKTKEETYENIKKQIIRIIGEINKNNWKVKLSPETTGKISQFATIDEISRLIKETKCYACIDIAHIKARNQGKLTYKEIFEDVINKIKIKHYHIHLSGIVWSEKGERYHINLTDENMKEFRELAEFILDKKKSVTIISESPSTWRDSLKMKKVFEELGYNFNQ